MPWYYVHYKYPTTGPRAFCVDFDPSDYPNMFTLIAGPFATQKECVLCQETGNCGDGRSGSSTESARLLGNKKFLCKSLQQEKYGRDVWVLQCDKINRVLAKNTGEKLGRDFYVAGGCGQLVHAKFINQRRHNRDIYVIGEGCCEEGSASGSESLSKSASSSSSGSASASASSASSVSSMSSESIVPSLSSISGSSVSGSLNGILTSCCQEAIPEVLSAVVFSNACPQYNGSYLLQLINIPPVGCALGQVWRNRTPPEPGEGCLSPTEPYIALICCDGVLTVQFEIGENAICLAPFPQVCEEYLVRQCNPILVQMEVSNKTWFNTGFPPTPCCTNNPDFLITIF